MLAYHEILKCRVCGSINLLSVLNLGYQELTGNFPNSVSQPITRGPLELVWCFECGLLQLRHSFEAAEMYGDNYGYRLGLNQSMVNHLCDKVRFLERSVSLQPNDVVLDIGSNDATLLKAFSVSGIKRIGIDPTGKKFSKYYTDGIELIPEFFSIKNIFIKKYSTSSHYYIHCHVL